MNNDFKTIQNSIVNTTKRILEGNYTNGLKLGFEDLDTLLGGLEKGSITVVGGRPSMGKSTFALNVLENVAINENKTCLFFSFDLPIHRFTERLLRQMTAIDITKELDDRERIMLYEESIRIEKAPIILEDITASNISKINEKAKIYAARNRLDLIIIDYLQLISISAPDSIESIMKSLKMLAQETECPIILLTQLNRAVEQRNWHVPMLSDIRGSGCIENEADYVLLLYRDAYYNKNSKQREKFEIFVAKNNAGERGLVGLMYLENCGKLISYKRFQT